MRCLIKRKLTMSQEIPRKSLKKKKKQKSALLGTGSVNSCCVLPVSPQGHGRLGDGLHRDGQHDLGTTRRPSPPPSPHPLPRGVGIIALGWTNGPGLSTSHRHCLVHWGGGGEKRKKKLLLLLLRNKKKHETNTKKRENNLTKKVNAVHKKGLSLFLFSFFLFF